MDSTSTFRVSAIPLKVLDRIRVAGKDDFENRWVLTVDNKAGTPLLRCCLRPSSPGTGWP